MWKYSTIIFDMDGTVLDTLEDLADSVNAVMTLFGYQTRMLDEVRCFVGNGVGRLIEQCLPDGRENSSFDQCVEAFKQHYAHNKQKKTRPYDGILALLDELKQRGLKLAIVSNKFDAAVKSLSDQYFSGIFDIAVGETPGMARKPAPDAVFKVLDELGGSAQHALYVGDSEVDAETANNAGLPFVGVTWGYRDRALLKENGARWLIDKPEELLGIVEGEE